MQLNKSIETVKNTYGKKVIAFVPRRSRIRLYKIAKAIKYTERYKLVLICEESYYDKNLFEGLFDEVHFFSHSSTWKDNKYYQFLSKKLVFSTGLNQLVGIINKVNPDLIHAFCEPYDHIQKILKRTGFPVIMTDGADFSGISGGIGNIDSKTRAQEKFCFENVQGLIYKGPKHVTQYYRSFGYQINCPELTWFDHCDEDLFVNPETSKLSDSDGEVHMVYTGNITTNPEMKYCYYPPLGEALSKQKSTYTYTAIRIKYKVSTIYKDMDRDNPYFHFHKPLPMKELISEIARYDWGLWIHAEDPSLRTQADKMKTGIGNKLFTYLEAGLPVIVSDSRTYGTDIVNREGIGFSINDRDWVNMSKMISEFDMKELRKKIEVKRKQLSLKNNGNQLSNFYENIIAT